MHDPSGVVISTKNTQYYTSSNKVRNDTILLSDSIPGQEAVYVLDDNGGPLCELSSTNRIPMMLLRAQRL